MPFHISPKLVKYFKGFCSSPEIINHSTLQRWIIRFVPLLDSQVRKRKKPTGSSWRMDETGSVASVEQTTTNCTNPRF